MATIGANVVIMHEGKILLTKREDFEVWCLPGGHVDGGESTAQAAIREAKEETGLDVALTKLIGIYSRTGSYSDVYITSYLAHILGGTLHPQIDEVIDIGYFAPDALPDALFKWHLQAIDDALNGVGGSRSWHIHTQAPEKVSSRQELYELRDRSGLSRVDFYRYYYEQPENFSRRDV